MRVDAPMLRHVPLRPARMPARRGVSDSRALLMAILGGLTLALYVHDPVGFQARVSESRSVLQEAGSWLTPTHFQAALVNLTR